MLTKRSPNSHAGDDEKRDDDSLDRLADFTRKIIAVPKDEIGPLKAKKKAAHKRKQQPT